MFCEWQCSTYPATRADFNFVHIKSTAMRKNGSIIMRAQSYCKPKTTASFVYIVVSVTCLTPHLSWWRHQMEIVSALLALCAGNSPVTSEFPAERPVTRSLDVFFDLRLNTRLSKQSRGWWFETPSRSFWRHCNAKTSLCVLNVEWMSLPLIHWCLVTLLYICVLVNNWFRWPLDTFPVSANTWTDANLSTNELLGMEAYWCHGVQKIGIS